MTISVYGAWRFHMKVPGGGVSAPGLAFRRKESEVRSQSTPVVLPQSATYVTVNTPGDYRRHGLLRGLLVLVLSGPVGLILYWKGSGAVGAIVGGILITALILLAVQVL